jgi:hypothetical protein
MHNYNLDNLGTNIILTKLNYMYMKFKRGRERNNYGSINFVLLIRQFDLRI